MLEPLHWVSSVPRVHWNRAKESEKVSLKLTGYAGGGYTVDFGDLFAAGERSRIELLTLELDLAFNFARLAEQYRDDASRERALRCAQIALGAVRHFEEQIFDPNARRRIHERGDELERFLALLAKPD